MCGPLISKNESFAQPLLLLLLFILDRRIINDDDDSGKRELVDTCMENGVENKKKQDGQTPPLINTNN